VHALLWVSGKASRTRAPQGAKSLKGLEELYVRSNIPLWKWPLSIAALPDAVERRLFGTTVSESHHVARLELVQKRLPPAQTVLDLGGSVGGIPEGGLLHMGYPHGPREVTIVDLPPPLQDAEYQRTSTKKITPQEVTHGPTTVRLVFSSLSDLSAFPDASVDMVWSGQSIEHVSLSEGRQMLMEAKRVLKKGGHLALDTPNRHVARHLTRWGLLHPEHKLEYDWSTLERMVKHAGFEAIESLAVSPMPLSLHFELFFRLEAYERKGLDDNGALGFSFALIAKH
jgi:ubiquinone/menaquinone biosynthesis C-methylase UbiE